MRQPREKCVPGAAAPKALRANLHFVAIEAFICESDPCVVCAYLEWIESFRCYVLSHLDEPRGCLMDGGSLVELGDGYLESKRRVGGSGD